MLLVVENCVGHVHLIRVRATVCVQYHVQIEALWYNLHYLIATPHFLPGIICTTSSLPRIFFGMIYTSSSLPQIFFWCAGHALRSAPKTGVISVGDTHPRTQNQMSYHRKFRNFKNSKSLKTNYPEIIAMP